MNVLKGINILKNFWYSWKRAIEPNILLYKTFLFEFNTVSTRIIDFGMLLLILRSFNKSQPFWETTLNLQDHDCVVRNLLCLLKRYVVGIFNPLQYKTNFEGWCTRSSIRLLKPFYALGQVEGRWRLRRVLQLA